MRAVSFRLVQGLGLGMGDLSAGLMALQQISVSPAFLFSPSVRTGAASPRGKLQALPRQWHTPPTTVSLRAAKRRGNLPVEGCDHCGLSVNPTVKTSRCITFGAFYFGRLYREIATGLRPRNDSAFGAGRCRAGGTDCHGALRLAMTQVLEVAPVGAGHCPARRKWHISGFSAGK